MKLSYGRQSISPEDVNSVTNVLFSDWLTIGPEVERFEEKISNVANASFAIAVSSGTAALHCAYKALDLKPGDEVITTPLTFIATAAMASNLGAKVVFADICADTGNLDPKSVENLITKNTKVISGVDFAGHPVDIDELQNLAKKNDAFFLEDASHSIGSRYKENSVGSLADITTFSFFPTKNLTTGEGGAIVTNNDYLASRSRKFKMHGLVRDVDSMRYPDVGPWHQEVHEFGLNYRLPDILCALGSSQIERLNTFKANRSKIFSRYFEGLCDLDWVRLPTQKEYVDPMWHLYPIRVPKEIRKVFHKYMWANEVMVQVNYIPVYWHPVYEDMGYKKGLCPQAEEYYLSEISLPMYPDLSEKDQDRVIELIRNFKV